MEEKRSKREDVLQAEKIKNAAKETKDRQDKALHDQNIVKGINVIGDKLLVLCIEPESSKSGILLQGEALNVEMEKVNCLPHFVSACSDHLKETINLESGDWVLLNPNNISAVHRVIYDSVIYMFLESFQISAVIKKDDFPKFLENYDLAKDMKIPELVFGTK